MDELLYSNKLIQEMHQLLQIQVKEKSNHRSDQKASSDKILSKETNLGTIMTLALKR